VPVHADDVSQIARAVVIGLDSTTGLQSARVLAARGVPVVALAGDRRHFGCRTRVCERIIETDIRRVSLVDELVALGPTLGPRAVLFPCTDLSVLLVSEYRDRLRPWYHVLLPDHDVITVLLDKLTFAEYANRHGIPIPQTVVLRDAGDAERAARTMSFPCLVKPAVKSARWQEHTNAKVFTVACPDELLTLWGRVGGWADALLAQEWVEGGEDALWSCNAYFDASGAPLATFVARKVRQWPPFTGTASSSVEERNDEVRDTAVRLFSGAGFHGLAYLEMKRDARTGRHVVIEPNVGRPTGRSAIAERGGVELLLTAYRDALGLPLPEARTQRYAGTRWLDLRRDVQAGLFFVRRGDLTVRAWLRSLWGPTAHAVWSARDPLPFLAELRQAAGKAARALAARRRGVPAGL